MKSAILLALLVVVGSNGSTSKKDCDYSCQDNLAALAEKFRLFDHELEVYNQTFFRNELRLADLYKSLSFVPLKESLSNNGIIIIEVFASKTLEVISIGSFFVDLQSNTIGKPQVIFSDDSGIGTYLTHDVAQNTLTIKESDWLTECLDNN